MTPEQIKKEADRLVEQFKPLVYPYLGSGMLTNTYDDDVIKSNATHCAILCVEEIIKANPYDEFTWFGVQIELESTKEHWEAVKQELENRLRLNALNEINDSNPV